MLLRRLLEIIAKQSLDTETVFSTLPNRINTPELHIPLPDNQKFHFMNTFLNTATFDNARAITIDGLRVEFNHGWGLVRASNTTPCLVLRFEANDETAMKSIQQTIKQQLLKVDPTLPIPF